jgi:hypothetical protein
MTVYFWCYCCGCQNMKPITSDEIYGLNASSLIQYDLRSCRLASRLQEGLRGGGTGSDKPRFMDFDIFSGPYRHSNTIRFTMRMMGWEYNIPVLRIHRDGAKSLDDSHSGAYASKNCVFVIKVRCWCQCQEKLRSCCEV